MTRHIYDIPDEMNIMGTWDQQNVLRSFELQNQRPRQCTDADIVVCLVISTMCKHFTQLSGVNERRINNISINGHLHQGTVCDSIQRFWALSQHKDCLSRYMYSHYKRQGGYDQNGNSYTSKITFYNILRWSLESVNLLVPWEKWQIFCNQCSDNISFPQKSIRMFSYEFISNIYYQEIIQTNSDMSGKLCCIDCVNCCENSLPIYQKYSALYSVVKTIFSIIFTMVKIRHNLPLMVGYLWVQSLIYFTYVNAVLHLHTILWHLHNILHYMGPCHL